MKKILLLLFVCQIHFTASAQNPAVGTYLLTVEFPQKVTYNAGGVWGSFYCEVKSNLNIISQTSIGGPRNGSTIPIVAATKEYRVNELSSIKIWGQRRTNYGLWEDLDERESNYTLDIGKGYISNLIVRADDSNNPIFPFTDGIIQVTCIPKDIDIAYVGNDREEQKLPSDDRITLKATKGFPPQLYNWKYSTDGINWQDIKSSVRISADRTEISFNGYELAGEEAFRSKLHEGGTINVGIAYDNAAVPQYIYTLYPSLTAPKIVDIEPILETCHGSGNSQLRVTFDRQLVDGNEALYLTLDGRLFEARDSDPIVIDQNNQGFVASVRADTYDVEVVSTYKGFTSYTNAINHSRKDILVESRPNIELIVKNVIPVSCCGGNNGQIEVTAKRGNESARFTASLYDGSDNFQQSIDFGSDELKSFVGLTAGNYFVRVKDENGCVTARQGVIVDQPPLAVGVSGNTVIEEPKGHDTKDGVFSFQIVGGRGDYAVQVVDAQTGTSPPCSITVDNNNNCIVSGIGRGTYNVTITDGSYNSAFGTTCGCRHDFEHTVTAPDPIVPTITNHKDALCYSDNNGSVTITAKGGRPYDPAVGTYDYLWYRKGESASFFNDSRKTASTYSLLTAGDYKVVVVDRNKIEAELEFVILEPNPVLVTFSANHISCNGGSDGSLAVVAQGGSGQYKSQLIGGENYSKELTFDTQASIEFTKLAAGNYYLYLTDANGCPMRDPDDESRVVEYYEVIITEPKKPVKIELAGTQFPVSYNSEDGVAVVRVLGGTTQNGEYRITAQSVAEGGILTHSSSIKDGAYTVYTFTGLKRGRYTIEASDDRYFGSTEQLCSCVDKIELELVAPAPMEVVLKEVKGVSCYGSHTAEMVANARGGVQLTGAAMPYKYKWYRVDRGTSETINATNDSIARNLGKGSYRVEVFDMKNVSVASDMLTVEEPDSLSISFDIADIDCSGANTGSIKATVQGGTAPYTYQWNVSGQNAPNISNIEMGIYTFKVTDSNGCSKVAQVGIKSAVEITVDSIIVQPSCFRSNGGSIELNLSGGSAPYAVQWSDNNSSELKREQLSAGTYRVVITDNKGCKVPYSFTLHEPHSFTVALPEDFTMCRNQSRTIKAVCAERDVTYKWYCDAEELAGSGNSITASRAGVYKVVATNQVGCTAQDELVVTVSSESLNLEMIAPTKVAVGTEIHAVNLSTVSAEVLTWSLPKEAIVLKRGDTEAIFMLDKAGHYEIALKGEKNGCSTVVIRTIEVVGSGDEQLPNDKKSLIKQFLVAPNPTKGYFKVQVELHREDDFTMKLYSPSGVLVDEKTGVKVQNKSFEYEINGSIQGTYLLHLITPYDKAVLQVVVKN